MSASRREGTGLADRFRGLSITMRAAIVGGTFTLAAALIPLAISYMRPGEPPEITLPAGGLVLSTQPEPTRDPRFIMQYDNHTLELLNFSGQYALPSAFDYQRLATAGGGWCITPPSFGGWPIFVTDAPPIDDSPYSFGELTAATLSLLILSPVSTVIQGFDVKVIDYAPPPALTTMKLLEGCDGMGAGEVPVVAVDPVEITDDRRSVRAAGSGFPYELKSEESTLFSFSMQVPRAGAFTVDIQVDALDYNGNRLQTSAGSVEIKRLYVSTAELSTIHGDNVQDVVSRFSNPP